MPGGSLPMSEVVLLSSVLQLACGLHVFRIPRTAPTSADL